MIYGVFYCLSKIGGFRNFWQVFRNAVPLRIRRLGECRVDSPTELLNPDHFEDARIKCFLFFHVTYCCFRSLSKGCLYESFCQLVRQEKQGRCRDAK
jgi:hypothetical protein